MTLAGSSAPAAALSARSNPVVRWKMPSTFVRMTRSQPESGNSSSGAPHVAPELLTRMCSVGMRARTSSASARAPSGVDRSAGIASHSPNARSSASAASRSPALRDAITTRTPA